MNIKFNETGYAKGFFQGQMQERKYWNYKIDTIIQKLNNEQETNKKDLYNAIELLLENKINETTNKICVNMAIRDILKKLKMNI